MTAQRLSVYAALICKSPTFWRFMQVETEPDAIAQLRTMCGIQSRAELDSDPAKAEILHRLVRIPFSNFNHQHQE